MSSGGRTRRDESLVGHDGNLRAMDAYSMMVWGGAASRAPNVIQPRYARMDGRYRKAGRPDSAAALRCEFAFAAAITIFVSLAFDNLKVEITFFAAISVLAIIFLRPLAKKLLSKNKIILMLRQ